LIWNNVESGTRAVSSRAFAGLHELYAVVAYDLGSQAKRSGVALV